MQTEKDVMFWELVKKIENYNKNSMFETPKNSKKLKKSKNQNCIEYRILASRCKGLVEDFKIVYIVADMNKLNINIKCKDKNNNTLSSFTFVGKKTIEYILFWHLKLVGLIKNGKYSKLLNNRYLLYKKRVRKHINSNYILDSEIMSTSDGFNSCSP